MALLEDPAGSSRSCPCPLNTGVWRAKKRGKLFSTDLSIKRLEKRLPLLCLSPLQGSVLFFSPHSPLLQFVPQPFLAVRCQEVKNKITSDGTSCRVQPGAHLQSSPISCCHDRSRWAAAPDHSLNKFNGGKEAPGHTNFQHFPLG